MVSSIFVELQLSWISLLSWSMNNDPYSVLHVILCGFIFSDRKGLGERVNRCLRYRTSPCEGNPQTLISAGWYLVLLKSHIKWYIVCQVKATCESYMCFPASSTFKVQPLKVVWFFLLGCVIDELLYWKGMFEKMSKYWKNHFEHIFCITFRRRGPHPKRSLPLPQAARNKPRYRPSLPRNRQSSSAPLSDLEFFCWLEHADQFCHIYL